MDLENFLILDRDEGNFGWWPNHLRGLKLCFEAMQGRRRDFCKAFFQCVGRSDGLVGIKKSLGVLLLQLRGRDRQFLASTHHDSGLTATWAGSSKNSKASGRTNAKRCGLER